MHIKINNDKDLKRFVNFPGGYPIGHPVDGEWQVPKLDAIELEFQIQNLVGFDDRGRASEPSQSAIHFYRDDWKFDALVENPLSWVYKLMEFGYVLTPDLSLGDEMPPWKRQERTCLSRAIGVIWQVRGLRVIPSLRWRSVEDLQFVMAGIAKQSTIAISNYGARLKLSDRHIFRSGSEEILETLKPKNVILYGSVDPNLQSLFESRTNLHTFKSPIDVQRSFKSAAHRDAGYDRLF